MQKVPRWKQGDGEGHPMHGTGQQRWRERFAGTHAVIRVQMRCCVSADKSWGSLYSITLQGL